MKEYGLIGKSLSHSFSKSYFTEKFNQLDIQAVYHNFECESIQDVEQLLSTTSCEGLNVTFPYKEEIIPLLDRLDPIAASVGAVNTIKKNDGKWVGYNTDVFGFKQMIKPFFKSHHERVIIFGTGGASKAVEYVFNELGANVIFISRNPSKSNEFGYNEINKVMLSSCFVLVNTTPVGTFPNIEAVLPIPFEFLTEKHLCIDLVYNPDETKFLNESKYKNAWVLNGKTMLHQQAEKAWEIWRS